MTLVSLPEAPAARIARAAPRRRRPGGPPGFTLVEVVVAVTLLAGGVLATAGAATVAARMLSGALAAEGAAAAAELVADSLLQAGAPAPGQADVGRYRVRWTVHAAGGANLVDLAVEYHDGTAIRRLLFGARAVAPPPLLETPP